MHFIHIPKTGGTSARAAVADSQDRRWQGHYPAWAVNMSADDMWSIVRNPYDRAVSLFFNFNGRPPKKDEMKRWFTTGIDRPLLRKQGFVMSMMDSQSRYICPHGVMLVGKVVRFEKLASDMKKSFSVKIPHENKSSRTEQLKDYYDEELRDIIYHRYKADFTNLGYSTEIPNKSLSPFWCSWFT